MKREAERKAELMKVQLLQEEQKMFQLESVQKDVRTFHMSLEAIIQRGDATEAGIPKIIQNLLDFLDRRGTIGFSSFLCCGGSSLSYP